jgi:hypothetical protein
MKGDGYVPRANRGFTAGQQGHFRPLVAAAWSRHSQLAKLPESPADKEMNRTFRNWYEEELKAATGKPSSVHCDRKRDFTRAMAHFEVIVGESIFWQTRLYGDDARRIAWNIREIVRANEVEEDYMRGMARRMLRLADDRPLPTLDQMEYEDLLVIMGELKRFLRRGGRPGVKQRGEEPF